MITMPRRLAHRTSRRGVAMVQLELDGRREWVVDYYDERQRALEAAQWKRERERKARVDALIAEVGKLYTT